MPTYHHVRHTYTTFPVKRTDRYGNRLASPGILQAHCDCGWEQGVRHEGFDMNEKREQFDKLIENHVDPPTGKPNEGHPFFQEIAPVPVMYRKRPIEVEARQWQPEGDPNNVIDWMLENKCIPQGIDMGQLLIPTLEGMMRVNPGDWVIRGVQSEFYPCKADIFAKTYEKVRPLPRLFEYPVC